MNIAQKIFEYQMQDDIYRFLINGDLLCKSHIRVNGAKAELRKACGIIFINVMAPKDNKYTIIAKTKNSSFIYEYDKITEQLTIKGERKNAIS